MKPNAGSPRPARVPTLTEVIEVADTTPPPADLPDDTEAAWERTARFHAPVHPLADTGQAPRVIEGLPASDRDATTGAPAQMAAVAPQPPIDEARLAERILGDVQRQVGVMLEHRIRETLAPALARLTDAVVQEARVELASALRDMVARAVAQELARQRAR